MKFLEHIKAIDTGNKQIIIEPLYAIRYDVNIDEAFVPKYAKEYSISVKLGANRIIDEDLIEASNGMIVELALADMKHAIFEQLYGDLKRDLYELRFKMREEYSYRDSQSMNKLTQILEQLEM